MVAPVVISGIITAATAAAATAANSLQEQMIKEHGANDFGAQLKNETPWSLKFTAPAGQPVHGVVLEAPGTHVPSIIEFHERKGSDEEIDNFTEWSGQSKGDGSQVTYLYAIEGFPNYKIGEYASQVPNDPSYKVDKCLYLAVLIHHGVGGGIEVGVALIGDMILSEVWDGEDTKTKNINDIIEKKGKWKTAPTGVVHGRAEGGSSQQIDLGPLEIIVVGGELVSRITLSVTDPTVWSAFEKYLDAQAVPAS